LLSEGLRVTLLVILPFVLYHDGFFHFIRQDGKSTITKKKGINQIIISP